MKTVAVLITTALATYLGLLNLSDRMEFKLTTDHVEWAQTPGPGVEASHVSSSQVPIRPGDRLLAVNDIPIATLNDYHNVLSVMSEKPFAGTPARYLVQRDAAELVFPVDIKQESQIGMADYFLVTVAFIYLAAGLFIYLRNGSATGAFHFYLLCLVAFILFLYRHSGRGDGFDIFVYWASAVALLLLPPMFLHFCCYFPEPIGLIRRLNLLKPALYAPFAGLLIFHLAWFSTRLTWLGLPRNPSVAAWIDRGHLLHFVVYFLAGAFLLSYLRRSATSSIGRQQMKWLSYGTLAGTVPFVLLYGIPFLLGSPTYAFMNASILGLALIPISFGYAITRFRLMDVDVIVKQGAAYLLTSSALLGVYMLIAILIGGAASRLSPESGFFLFAVCAVLVALLFAPLRNRVQQQIDRLFYKDEYDYRQSMADFGRTLASEIDLNRLADRICTRVSRSLNIGRVELYLGDRSGGNRYDRLLGSLAEESAVPMQLVVPNSIFADFDRELNPLFVCPPDEEITRLKAELGRRKLYYVQPLRVHGRLLGFLALGRKAGGDLLSTEDLDLVSGLANYAAIALDNALLYQSLEHKAQQLEQLRLYAENVVESLVAGVAVVTPDGEVTVWNQAMRAISGLPPAEAVGRNVREVLPPDLVTTIRNLFDGRGWTVQEPGHLRKAGFASKDGSTRLVNVSVAPFFLEGDINTGTLLLFDDVTEKARLEDQLLQAEKLSSIGLFAAGVAHEVNTPLAGISSYTQMLLKEASEGSPQTELLKKIERQSFRASNIVNSLLKFARVTDTEVHAVNLNSLMVDTLSLIDHQLKKGQVGVSLDLDPSLPTTLGNGGRLQQVFMNLFVNAKDAMPEGGQLRLRSYRQDSTLVIKVQDTGRGISSADIKRIYDPFFTTKAVGKGTGLGLSVTYGIIQEHSGQISVESEPGKGTTFTLQLPLRRVN